ncbi:MAG: asparagine synthetase B family protein [Bacteroidota bacterium]|nr:asparagine synthetase B family protein [Bacteroidota bacterium]
MSELKGSLLRTEILPLKQTFVNVPQNKITDWVWGKEFSLDYKAICYFVSTGFFPNDTTYFNEIKVLPPATQIDEDDILNSSKPYWKWHYDPKDITLKQAVEEFAHLFEKISFDQVNNKRVILPISGGLDSRTQATALRGYKDVYAYSYKFKNGLDETGYGAAVAKAQNFKYKAFEIQPSYLWDVIEQLADINKCFSEFTHPRQMSIHHLFEEMGDIFYLGHWGDVLFDDMGVPSDTGNEELVKILYKKILKKGGLELGKHLWEVWGLEGTFEESLKELVLNSLEEIKIDDANARLRAYKSMQWAPRWTSNNLSVFLDKHPLALPYFHDDMCKFVCTIPEQHLSGRQIQIEYIKTRTPQLAKVPWQTYDPCNLYNYDKFNSIPSLMVRAGRKVKYKVNQKLMKQQLVQRNWEIQFLGAGNEAKLENYMFKNDSFKELLPESTVREFYKNFREKDLVFYSHPLSMLLTLSLFSKREFGK